MDLADGLKCQLGLWRIRTQLELTVLDSLVKTFLAARCGVVPGIDIDGVLGLQVYFN